MDDSETGPAISEEMIVQDQPGKSCSLLLEKGLIRTPILGILRAPDQGILTG
jgi:hypothetical protein